MALPAWRQSIPATVDYVFALEYQRLVEGDVEMFSIAAHWKPVIGQSGIKLMSKKLGRNLYADIRTFAKDDRIFFEATEITADYSVKEKEVDEKAKSNVKTPRPPNKFILYRQHHHESIKAKYPGYSNTALSQIIGAKWRSEPARVRKIFEEMARDIKEEHSKLFPEYSYQPRKSADKKRRMTAAKAAQVDAFAQALVSKNDTTNNEFVPAASKPNPMMVPGKLGNLNYASFVVGDPITTAKEIRTLVETNNQKFSVAPTIPAHDNAPVLLAAAPTAEIEDDMLASDSLDNVFVRFNGSWALDGQELDQEYDALFANYHVPTSFGFGGDVEIGRQGALNQ